MNTATQSNLPATLGAQSDNEQHNDKPSVTALMLNDQNLQRMLDFSKIMASGKVTVPDMLRNPGDCLAITMQALQWGMNPFAVAQKTHVIHGTLGYEAQLVNAVINTMAPTKDRIHYEWFGPWEKILGRFAVKKSSKPGGADYRVPDWELKDEAGIGIRVWATLKGEEQPRELELLLCQAVTRNSTLWAEDPRQQLAYLAVKRWSRLYCPDVILGVYTADELESMPPKEINPIRQTGAQAAEAARHSGVTIDPEKEKERAELIARLEDIARNAGTQPYADEWAKLTKEQRKLIGGDDHERLKKLAATQKPQEASASATAAEAAAQ